MDYWICLWVSKEQRAISLVWCFVGDDSVVSFASIYATLYLGNSIGYAAIQGQMVISGLWGLCYYHEVRGVRNITQFFISMVLTVAGVILLAIFG